MSAPLYGLLLTGGRSRRMQRDKLALEYGGQPQLARAMALLEPLVERSFISVRADQRNDPQRSAFPCITDVLPDIGPIGGIHAALCAHPEAAWLVLAGDLPFLDTATLQQLIAARAPQRLATAFRSSHDGKPEPLCAIFEPASLSSIAAEYLQARGAFAERGAAAGNGAGRSVAGVKRRLKIQYFALLREQAGRSEETVTSDAADARALYAELSAARGLKLRPEQLRVAINEAFADWSHSLSEGDTVVSLPPVAGG